MKNFYINEYAILLVRLTYYIFLYYPGLSKKLINNLMSLEMGESFTWEEYGLDIRDTAITWLNDLETDERYRRWSTTYMELLRPTYPGMLRNLRKNIYNYVSIIKYTLDFLFFLVIAHFSSTSSLDD